MTNNPLFTFQWHITDKCDQRCRHCYLFAEDGSIPIRSATWDDMLRVLATCEDMCASLSREPYFYLTGGDPILHPDFWRLAEELHARGHRWCVLGNPFHLTPETCGRMAALGCRKYQLSLDGMRETHDAMRKPGSFDATMAAIPLIQGAGMWANLMSTVSSANAGELPDMIDLAAEAGADVFAFSRYCPTSGQAAEEFHMEPLEYREVLLRCQERIDAHRAAGAHTEFQLKDHLWKLLLWEQGRWEIPTGADTGMIYDGCHCGIAHMTILPDGEVYACRRMESPVGNLRAQSAEEVFLGQAMEAHRDFDSFEKCTCCELFSWCRGCPAVAAGYTGNMYAPDPQCWHEIKESEAA
jgi:radical SAM/SPASM domain protein of ACGX system